MNEIKNITALYWHMHRTLYTMTFPTQYPIPRGVGLGRDREAVPQLELSMGLAQHLPLIQRVDDHLLVHHALVIVP